MLRKIVAIVLTIILMSLGIAFADDNYPYRSVCPEGDRYFDGTDALVCNGSDCFYKDRWSFAQCNCTSYIAWRINDFIGLPDDDPEPVFTNNYQISRWGNAYEWKGSVDNETFAHFSSELEYLSESDPSYPWKSYGSGGVFDVRAVVAWWENGSGALSNGHVAFVENIVWNSDKTGVVSIKVSEYNWDTAEQFGQRILYPGTDDYPTGFLYIVTDTLIECRDTGLCQEGGGSGGGGGDEPKPKPNLRIYSVTIEDPNGNDLSEQASYMNIGQTYKVKVYPISEDEDCENGVDSDTENVETDIYYKISHEDSDGEWVFLERVYTRPSTLTEGNPNKETVYFTVPASARAMRVYFKAIVDSTGEVSETNEDDNVSYWEKEWYPVAGETNLVINTIYLVDEDYTLKLGDNFRIGMGVQNIGTDTPLVGFRSGYYVKRPNETDFTKWDEDGSDADELTPGTIQWEATPIGGWATDQIGTWQVKVCADIYQDVPETDESDNCQTLNFTVSPIGPDFTVSDMYLKVGSKVYRSGSSVPEDSYVHPYCEVTNIGNSGEHPGFRIAYYINKDKYRDSDGIDPDELCAGCSKTEYVSSNSIRLGDTGTRSYRCCVDYQNNVSELDETNNCKTFYFSVK